MKWWHHALIGAAITSFIIGAIVFAKMYTPETLGDMTVGPIPERSREPAVHSPPKPPKTSVDPVKPEEPRLSLAYTLRESAEKLVIDDFPDARGEQLKKYTEAYSEALKKLDKTFPGDYVEIAKICMFTSTYASPAVGAPIMPTF